MKIYRHINVNRECFRLNKNIEVAQIDSTSDILRITFNSQASTIEKII